MVLVLSEMQSLLSRIWTLVAVSISYNDNHYTMGTFENKFLKTNKSANRIKNIYKWIKF